jgi:hypothetical protein
MNTTQYACPSPSGRNDAGLYLTKAGALVDRDGRYWGQSAVRRLAQDAALAPETSGRTQRSTAEWAQSHARAALFEALEEACREHELGDDAHEQLRDLVERTLKGEADDNRGMGALDDESELDDKIREYLRGKGLADDDVEKAIELARKDREEARDSRPENAIHGGRGGRFSGATKDDVDRDYPNNLIDMPDYSPDPDRFAPHYDPLKMRDPARNLPGGGVSRRLAGDGVEVTDAEMAREYPGIENCIAGY